MLLGLSNQGQLVDTTGLRTWGRIAWDSWSTSWALGPRSELPGTACRPCLPSEPGPSNPGQLVDPAGSRSLAEVARDCYSTPRDLGPGPESPV